MWELALLRNPQTLSLGSTQLYNIPVITNKINYKKKTRLKYINIEHDLWYIVWL